MICKTVYFRRELADVAMINLLFPRINGSAIKVARCFAKGLMRRGINIVAAMTIVENKGMVKAFIGERTNGCYILCAYDLLKGICTAAAQLVGLRHHIHCMTASHQALPPKPVTWSSSAMIPHLICHCS